MARAELDISALYEQHGEVLLLFFVRRTADIELALDLWAETLAQALAGRARCRGRSDEETAGWLYAIAARAGARPRRTGLDLQPPG